MRPSFSLISPAALAALFLFASPLSAQDSPDDSKTTDDSVTAEDSKKPNYCKWPAFKQELEAKRSELHGCFADHTGHDGPGASGLRVTWTVPGDASEPTVRFETSDAGSEDKGNNERRSCVTTVLEKLGVSRTGTTTCQATFDLLYAPQSAKKSVVIEYKSWQPAYAIDVKNIGIRKRLQTQKSRNAGNHTGAQKIRLRDTPTRNIFGRRRGLDAKVQQAEDRQPGDTSEDDSPPKPADIPIDADHLSTSEGCNTDDLLVKLVTKQNGLNYCYARELEDHPELAGRMTVGWTITPKGVAKGATVTDDELGSEAVQRCVKKMIERMRFKVSEQSCQASFQLTFDRER